MIEFMITVLSGVAVCVPIIIALGSTISDYIKEKNWSAIVSFVLDYMTQAESLFEKGVDRKIWVMEMLEETVIQLNYTYDEEAKAKVSAMIDSICDASKIINSEVVVDGT